MQYLVDEFEKSLPPMGHPLRKLGVRLTELLGEDQWAECERLLLEGWEHDAADRATGARWRANSSLDEWFPYTHEELKRMRETLQGIAAAPELLEAATFARDLAMRMTAKADIPYCAEFSAIAQELDAAIAKAIGHDGITTPRTIK